MKRIILLGLVFIAFTVSAQTPLFINEIHYDNADADANEFIEIAGPANTDLDAAVFTLVLYTGSTGASYNTVTLSGKLSDNGCGFGFSSVSITGIQNGNAANTEPDGIALVKDGAVLQFISYEGSFVATNGAASGMTSTDIGVAEDGTSGTGTLATESLQLTGSGTDYEDFTWSAPAAHTKDAENTNQTFTPVVTTEISFASAAITELESAGTIAVTLSLNEAAKNDATVTISVTDNTTISGTDYLASVGVLDVKKGETSITFNVVISDDAEVETDETFTATIDATSCTLNIGSVTSTIFTITDNDVVPVGIEERLQKTIQVYPNPSKGVINVKNNHETEIEIYNSIGELVKVSKENKINLDKGIYILKIDGLTKTVIVE